MKIGPIIEASPPLSWKMLVGDMNLGNAREVTGTPEELYSARRQAIRAANMLGMRVTTRLVREEAKLIVYRVA